VSLTSWTTGQFLLMSIKKNNIQLFIFLCINVSLEIVFFYFLKGIVWPD
jgi:hypothetical protein